MTTEDVYKRQAITTFYLYVEYLSTKQSNYVCFSVY